MARFHGNKSRLYMAIASGGSAEPMANTVTLGGNWQTDKVDVTSQGDGNKSYVSGLADAQGTFDGFFDTASSSTYLASTDGVSRKFYLYPDATNSGRYWYGLGLFDFGFTGAVNDAAKFNGTWAAAGAITPIGM